jgi:hypothetical protein
MMCYSQTQLSHQNGDVLQSLQTQSCYVETSHAASPRRTCLNCDLCDFNDLYDYDYRNSFTNHSQLHSLTGRTGMCLTGQTGMRLTGRTGMRLTGRTGIL